MAITLKPRNNNNLTNLNKVNLNTLSEERLQSVKMKQKDLDHQFLEEETKRNAAGAGMPYIDLVLFPINSTQLNMMDYDQVKEFNKGVFAAKDKTLYMATTALDPEESSPLYDLLKEDGYTYKLFHASQDSIDKLLKVYKGIQMEKGDDGDVEIEDAPDIDYNLKNIQKLIEDASVSDVIDIMLTAALKNNASDIHLEPEKEEYNLRLRIDGVLSTFAHFKKSMQKNIESRIKTLAKLKINVDNIPQDGRFTFHIEDKEIDVRTSMLPSNYGYSTVMRLLGTGSVNLVLEDLGFTGLAKERIEEAVGKPQGMILNTGPTGSGKSTTLYTFLNQLNDDETKIITLEDPIEYKLEGISQTQIDKNAGYTFSAGLRSILRQDPDVVMLGEIRDNETAEIATQAALTGHLVLSTLHTNDAAGAITRFLELGVPGFSISDSLSAVIGQRLMRRLCKHCKRPTELDEIEQKVVNEQLAKLPNAANVNLPDPLVFYTADGCEECGGLGYKGRVGAYEVLNVTEGLRNLLSSNHVSVQDVRHVAQEEGMVTMLQDGILKAIDGTTDMKEVLRTIQH